MILDYAYNKTKRVLSISYIKDNGMKEIRNFNVDRFKTFYSTPSGKFENWDGSKCDIKWTDKPDKFDIKTYIEELSPEYKNKLSGKTSPKLYTWDIEVVSDDEFPTASEAKYPVVTISVCSPDCNVIILGTKNIGNNGDEYLNEHFGEYISKLDYFKKLGLPTPTIKYIQFNSERDMLQYFLTNIVAKVPVLAGWNSMLFDWQYIQNRLRGYYPDINLACSSANFSMDAKNYTDMVGNKVKLIIPQHTVMLDMMDIVGSFDYVVMPIKESLSLDYIAYESLGVNKIAYEGSLNDLYYNDYKKYVFYNAIDSVLVQMIDKRFKTLQNIYTQALYCREKIGLAFSKIAVSEALVFNYFYDNGIKVIPERKHDVERGQLTGAYVRVPTPGKHNYVCCNDFASLYPSSIISCNLSFENFMGSDFTEEELNNFRNDKNYFVSVLNTVYKNDKDYAFKVIQSTLKANRNTFKYLAKGLEADVMSDLDHIIKGHEVNTITYKDEYTKAISELGYNITSTQDLYNIDLKEFKPKLATLIEFYTSYEQAMKLLGNSMYGGSSHISFFWFNMGLANDITGEARNVIHMMENHIPEYIRTNWPYMKDVHKQLGITVDANKAEQLLKDSGKKSYVDVIYGDTDSCIKDSLLITYDKLLKQKIEVKIEDLFYEMKNKGYTLRMTDRYGTTFVKCDKQILNWSLSKKLYFANVKYIMQHAVTKAKWQLITKSGKDIIVTNDHSMIVFRNGKQLEVKPEEILSTDKVLIVINNGHEYFFDDIESCECIGMFEDEYVYDIEMDDDTHTFIANDILVHNSLYISYDTFVKSIDNHEKLSLEEKAKIVVEFNTKFLDAHNREFMDAHYKERHVKSVQNFELETLALSGVWLDVKKRYAQVLLWKDGKYYDTKEELPIKAKGLELIKASYPKQAREGLKRLVRYLLEDEEDSTYLLHRLNIKMQQEKQAFFNADMDDICGSIKVSNYNKYIIDDTNPLQLLVAPKCPFSVKALGNYNRIRQGHNLPGDPIYGGKLKWFVFYPIGSCRKGKNTVTDYFAYPAKNYPKWADKYAPVAKNEMFQKLTLDPFNRIIEAVGIGTLSIDGSIQMSLF